MLKNKRKVLIFINLMVLLFISTIGPVSTASAAGGLWYGDPDPYSCNDFDDCYWIVTVCIGENTYNVGYYLDPATRTDKQMEEDALAWTGTVLTVGKCEFAFTGRWVHIYPGKTWTCNLVSEADEDKNASRFSNIDYVKDTCGEHELFGPYEGTADYKLCREKSANGILFCGNVYDTSY